MAIYWPSHPSVLGNINRFFTRYAAEKLALQTILRAGGPVFVGACSAIRLYVNQKDPARHASCGVLPVLLWAQNIGHLTNMALLRDSMCYRRHGKHTNYPERHLSQIRLASNMFARHMRTKLVLI